MNAKKREQIDFMALTEDHAVPMAEATQRQVLPANRPAGRRPQTPTQNLEQLAFRVPPEFRRQFQVAAAEKGMKLNTLLFEAFDAWLQIHGKTKI